MAPPPGMPPSPSLTCAEGQGRRGTGEKGPVGSFTARGPEQSLRRGLQWPRGRGQPEGMTHGDRHGTERLIATLARPSGTPTLGQSASVRPRHRCQPALTTYSEQEFLVVKKRLQTMNLACARKSCSKCCHTDLLNSHLQAMSPTLYKQ